MSFWICLLMLGIFHVILPAQIFPGMGCRYDHPKHGSYNCVTVEGTRDKNCTIRCNEGYEFVRPVAAWYRCRTFGPWVIASCMLGSPCPYSIPWPDCEPSAKPCL